MKKTNRIMKGEHMKKILPKMLTLIFAGALVITSTVNIDRNLQAQAHSLSGNVNELGIDSSVLYNSDNTSAALSVDMSSLDTEKYEVKQILGPNGEALDLISPSVNVSDNGDYLIKVQYIDKIAVVEVPEVTPEVEPTPSDTEGDGVLSGEVAPEGTPEAAVAPVEEVAPVVEEVVEQPAPVTVAEPEIKEIELATQVNGIVIAGTQTEEVSNSVVENAPQAFAAASPRAVGSTDLNEIFDVEKSTVGVTPLKLANNVNANITGNKLVYYDANAVDGIPTHSAINIRKDVTVKIPAKNEVSMKANWTFDGRVKAPYLGQMHWNGAIIQVESSDFFKRLLIVTDTGNRALLQVNEDESAMIYNRVVIGDSTYLQTEREFSVTNVYNSANNTSTLSIKANGQSKSTTVSLTNDTALLTMVGDFSYRNTYSAHGLAYPINAPSYFIFDGFRYDNFNPQFDDLKWFDSSNNEITADSKVNSNDILTVRATVRNGTETSDVIPAKLFLSDNDALAATKGVEAAEGIEDGILIKLSKDAKEVEFNVKVKDTIGDISLGLRLEDDFFHAKEYKEVKSNISVGEIFVDGTPTYTVMEYARDASGAIMDDSAGNPTYVEATNQNLLTQDSFVKVEGELLNPRTNEELTAIVKADLTNVRGLDYDNVQDLKLENGTGTSLVNGLTFTLAKNDGTGSVGTGSFSYVVPVKQTPTGDPFDTSDQVIDYTIDGSFVHKTEGPVTGTWLKTDDVSKADLKPIIDVGVDLSTTEISLERAEQFSLHNKLEFAASSNGENAHLDSIKFEHKHAGDTELLKMFGLESATHKVGTVHAFASDGTTMESKVSYNQVILLSDNKRATYEHYTRLGTGVNAPPRTKTETINLKVSGGIIQPEAFFEIPDYVQLTDQGGINNTYAGAKATIGIKDNLSTTNVEFDVTGDTDFKIKNEKQDFYLVSLFDDTGTEMTKVGDQATVGTFDKNNLKKVVWFNTVKDITRTDTEYKGTMTFTITSK